MNVQCNFVWESEVEQTIVCTQCKQKMRTDYSPDKVYRRCKAKSRFTCQCGFSSIVSESQFPLHCWCGRTHYGFLDSSDRVVQCKAGLELSKLLKLIRIEPTPDCKCTKRAKTMDVRGCQWCRDNLDTIDGWLREEATRRGLPYSSFVGRRLAMLAIKRAEKSAQSS